MKKRKMKRTEGNVWVMLFSFTSPVSAGLLHLLYTISGTRRGGKGGQKPGAHTYKGPINNN